MSKKSLWLLIFGSIIVIGGLFSVAFTALKEQSQTSSSIHPTIAITPLNNRPIIRLSPTLTPFPTGANGVSSKEAYLATYQEMEERDKKIHPEIFVANKLPLSLERFSLESVWQTDGSFLFQAKAKKPMSKANLQELVEDWLLSLGLTKKQIKRLNIKY